MAEASVAVGQTAGAPPAVGVVMRRYILALLMTAYTLSFLKK